MFSVVNLEQDQLWDHVCITNVTVTVTDVSSRCVSLHDRYQSCISGWGVLHLH